MSSIHSGSGERVPIFRYHRIGPHDGCGLNRRAAELSRRLTVSPDCFGFQMWLMAKLGYRTISMDELADGVESGCLPCRRFVVSFDDGYADFYEHALPILERHDFTAIVYLVASRVGEVDRWDEGLGFPLKPLLSWDQIRSMAGRGIEFGSHTCSHARLTTLDDGRLRDEIALSRTMLEEGLQRPVRHFCYPYGAHDAQVIEAVKAAGFRTAVTTAKGWVKAGASLLAQPRVKVSRNLRFILDLALGY